jgi:hypothetical protein
VSGTWIDGGAVHLDDVNGWPTSVPKRALHILAQYARQSDAARAKWVDENGTRWFDRDTLNGAVGLLDSCTYADQFTACDQPAAEDGDGNPITDLRDRLVCERHAPDDDKDA